MPRRPRGATSSQTATGFAEVLAGALLMIPATATAGAALALLDMLHVFLLNMAYDFGLKQISFHLLVMAAVLLACKLAAGQTLPHGAYACMGLLALADFEPEFARWDIETRIEESASPT